MQALALVTHILAVYPTIQRTARHLNKSFRCTSAYTNCRIFSPIRIESENLSQSVHHKAPLEMLKPAVVTENIAKRNQSKYDFVKVRVWVEDHVYVLSRYLVCRALVSTKVRDEYPTERDLFRSPLRSTQRMQYKYLWTSKGYTFALLCKVLIQ